MSQKFRASACLWICVGALWGCRSDPESVRPNWILVTWDTTRADVFQAETAPRMVALAESGVRFTNARTPVPLTLPAHTSLLSGRYPHEHGVRLNGVHEVGPDVASLAETLQAQGYATGAFVSAAVLEQETGLSKGFDHYDDTMSKEPGGQYFAERPSPATAAAAARWVEGLDSERPFFLWVHFFDPHRPWEPSDEALALHAFPYAAEVWDTDRSTRALLDQIEHSGRLQNSLFVLTADHGESLGEHGEWTHGAQIYDSTQRVPLVFWAGAETGLRLKSGHVASEPVSLVDVAPTVAGLLSVDFPTTGVDLAGVLRGDGGVEERDLLMESGYGAQRYQAAPVFGVVRNENLWVDSPKPERYVLSDDPGQLDNRFDALADGPVLTELQTQYPRNPEGLIEQKSLSIDQIEKLRALGYMAGSSVTGIGKNLPTTDIKDRREMISLLQSGALGIAPQVAMEKLSQWDREFGPIAEVDEMRVSLLDYLGQVENADAWFEARKETDEVVRADLERRYALRAEKTALIAVMEQALLDNPDHPTVRADLALTLWQVGKMESARGHFESALASEPSNQGLRGDAVRFFIALDDLPQALVVLAQAEQPLSGALLCLRARVNHMMGEHGDLTDLRGCQEQGGELGPTERDLLHSGAEN